MNKSGFKLLTTQNTEEWNSLGQLSILSALDKETKGASSQIDLSEADSVKKIISKLTNGAFPKPRISTLKKINKINTNELIDEGIIIWFPGPQSYTGEDMA